MLLLGPGSALDGFAPGAGRSYCRDHVQSGLSGRQALFSFNTVP